MSLKRNFDFRIASGHGCIHGGNHAVDVAVDGRPLRIAEYHDGDSPAFQVLLVLDIFVRGKQKVEPRFLGCRQQFAVRQGIPASCYGFYNRMTEKPTGNASRRTVVKENEHRRKSNAPERVFVVPSS